MNIIKKILFLPDYLNGFGMGDPERNGEYRFLRNYVKNKMTIFDVGANIGEYTRYLLNYCEPIEVHSFEPVVDTFNELRNRTDIQLSKSKVFLNNIGLSNKKEEKEINIYGKLAGINSLYSNDEVILDSNVIIKEKIKLITVDEYISMCGIHKIHLIKIDVEGYESNVIYGAESALKKKIIKVIQFEYGSFWKNSEKSLTDICEFLSDYSFKIYRLTPWGKILISKINNQLNNYKHSNYLAILKQ